MRKIIKTNNKNNNRDNDKVNNKKIKDNCGREKQIQ